MVDLDAQISARNPAAQRREAVSGADLLRDGSTPARKLEPAAFQEPLIAAAVAAQAVAGTGSHEEAYKARHEAGTPSENEPVTLARGGHNHDYTHPDTRETLDDPDADTLPDPISAVSSAPHPPFGSTYSKRVVTWSWTGAHPAQPCRILGSFSSDAGATWSPLVLVGVSRPGEDQFIFDAPDDYDFNPSVATPAQERYVVIPLLSPHGSAAGRLVRAGYDGKIALAYIPSSVATDAEVTAAIAAHAAAADPHTGYVKADGTRAFTGDQSMGSHKLTNVTDPTSDQDAATQKFVNNRARVKTPVDHVGLANVTKSGNQTLDGVPVVGSTNVRVLLTAQTSASENGIWVTASGAWTRATDADSWDEIVGLLVWVRTGTTKANTFWACSAVPGGTLDTTGIAFYQPPANVNDTDVAFTDNTTSDVSTTKHGYAPKAPNDTAKFLRGDGSWATAPGRLRAAPYTYVSGTGTHTPQSGTTLMLVRGWGGGGGGGGVSSAAASASGGGGGGSGGYFEKWYSNPAAMNYSVGAGGAGGAAGNNAGAAGGNTAFDTGGTAITAYGGSGGAGQAAAGGSAYVAAGAGGVVSTNGDMNGAGAPGGVGGHASGAYGLGGAGGSVSTGGGGTPTVSGSGVSTAGVAATSHGAGGSGGSSASNAGNDVAGGNGAAGRIECWEFM